MLRPHDGVLARLTRDLTAEARAGRLDPVRCRDAEIDRVIDVLLRRDKNNPVLLGEAGVGKTAIAEGLAHRLAAGTVPLSLRNVRLLALDHVSLLAGTMYRGQYEERIRGLVAEASAAQDVVLFIDELHNLIGQGTAVGVAMDAANMLKPALVRGDFRVLGATTAAEYDRWIRPDPPLERRFHPVPVRELSADETMTILEARREVLEQHHFAAIADDALSAAIRLTDLFLPERRRPDRALDVLDEASAHAHAVAVYSPEAERLIRRMDGEQERPAAAHERREERSTEEGESPDGLALDGLARDGFAALERLGAELEAMLGMEGAHPAPQPQSAPRRTWAEPGEPRPEPGAPAAPVRSRAERWVELRRRLIEEGVVVRGTDIARVVSLITGKRVTWVE